MAAQTWAAILPSPLTYELFSKHPGKRVVIFLRRTRGFGTNCKETYRKQRQQGNLPLHGHLHLASIGLKLQLQFILILLD